MRSSALETKHRPVYTLSKILALKTVPVLKKVARCHGVTGLTGFTKADLIEAIPSAMLDESKIADTLTLTDDDEWELFQKAASCRELPAEEAPEYDPIFLMGIGYLEAFRHNDKLVFVVPDEIKQALNSLMQSGYEDERSYITQLNKYALAATSLYGIITIDDFVELFNSQNERKTNVEDVCSLLLRFISLDAGYCYWKEYIVHDGFEDNDFKDVEDLAKASESKPRYLPDKEDFLKYADDVYFEATPQMRALKTFIEKLNVGEDEVCIMLLEIHRHCSVQAKMQPIMDVFNSRGVSFDSTEQANELTGLVVELMNNTRLWANLGHTPNELAIKEEAPAQRQLPVRSTKIGRNEPCPCGSGKKYKKCCLQSK
jgi:hypothetical protein